MTAHRIAFIVWPGTKALPQALAEEAMPVAQRVHPDVANELTFQQAEVPEPPAIAAASQFPGEPWSGRLHDFQKLFM
ncbi:AraC family transcriptional regulator, partial [Pseudomonas syringae pv. tagetis]